MAVRFLTTEPPGQSQDMKFYWSKVVFFFLSEVRINIIDCDKLIHFITQTTFLKRKKIKNICLTQKKAVKEEREMTKKKRQMQRKWQK